MAGRGETVTLERDCEAFVVPAGVPVKLRKGRTVTVTQSLGGDVTVNADGNLLQIPASEADALGEGYGEDPGESVDKSAPLEQQVWDVLRTCYDPEIPVNLVELGLIYECGISELLDGRTRVDIKMTLTAPGCGMGPVIAESVKNKVKALPDVDDAGVEIVFDPPWSREMMSEAAQLELGIL